MADFSKARAMLNEFKGDAYIHGLGVLPQVGKAPPSMVGRPR